MSVFISALLLVAALYALFWWLPDYCRTTGPAPWENAGFWFILILGLLSTGLLILEVSKAWQ